MYDLPAIKAALPLSHLVQSRVSFDPRKSNARRGDWWACCPFHQETTPSFHVDDAKGFYYCFGCGAKGDHLTWCQEMLGAGDFREACAMLAERAGMAETDRPKPRASRAPQKPDRAALNAQAHALALWREAEANAPLLRDYLASRGVVLDALDRALGGVPATLRLHRDLPYLDNGPDGRRIERWRGPAMLGAIGRTGKILGVHRTWITATGRKADARGKLDKRWLGRTGALYGNPVVIARAERLSVSRMIAGEGIESVLALFSRLAEAGELWAAEAALSRGALCGEGHPQFAGPETLPNGRLAPSPAPDFARPGWLAPNEIDDVLLLVEGSSKDPLSAARLSQRAELRHAWRADGRARQCRQRLIAGRWDRDFDEADDAKAAMAAAAPKAA